MPKARPTRRTVMKAFGMYLDYVTWKARAQVGLDEPPEGDTIADMARSVINCEENYRDLVTQYVQHQTKEED